MCVRQVVGQIGSVLLRFLPITCLHGLGKAQAEFTNLPGQHAIATDAQRHEFFLRLQVIVRQCRIRERPIPIEVNVVPHAFIAVSLH